MAGAIAEKKWFILLPYGVVLDVVLVSLKVGLDYKMSGPHNGLAFCSVVLHSPIGIDKFEYGSLNTGITIVGKRAHIAAGATIGPTAGLIRASCQIVSNEWKSQTVE
ncbi:MAG: hypothetical protein DPW09_43050 [Anaerolineae bacterium]|nr:hypothetical protein [Anaerolineae bacterium]